MSAEFRVVHFITDPFLGARIPIAALVREQSLVRCVRAKHLPNDQCLGGGSYAAMMRMILEALHAATDFHELPSSVGPFATMAEPMPLPVGVRDAAQWIRRHVLPTPSKEETQGTTREPHRASLGYQFFETRNLQRYVIKKFDVERNWNVLGEQDELPPATSVSTDPISHWVADASNVWLMEPLIPHRQSFKKDLHNVARNFSAYRYFLEQLKTSKDVRLVVYMLRSTAEQERAFARTALQAAHQVVDLSNLAEEKDFVKEIRAMGTSQDLVPPAP